MSTYLKQVGNYTTKPNFMTEYSGMSWLKTAQFINSALKNANSSAYIYWELMWAPDSDKAMIQVDNSGNYTITPFYYLIKHYAKNVDKGFMRIDASSENTGIDVVAFKNPANSQVTLILINTTTSSRDVSFDLGSASINSISAWQSKESDLFNELTNLSVDKPVALTSKSITTVVLEF